MPISPAARSSALSGVAFAGMFVFGIVMALLGAVMPVLSERLSLTLADVGTLFLVMNAAMLVASLFVGLVMDRFGLKLPLGLGCGLVAGGLVTVAMASRFVDLLPAVVCLGLGGGALNGGTNTLVADLHDDPQRKASALNLLGVFFGFGALLLPFTLALLVSELGMAGLLAVTASLCAVVGVATVTLRFPAAKQVHGWPLAQMSRFLRMPAVLSMGLLLFFQSGNEFVLGGYVASFLTREMALPIETASYTLAGYWAAIMLSRLFLSRLVLRFDRHALILGAALLSAAGAVMTGVASTTPIAVACIVSTGAALAGIFPTVLAVAGTRFQSYSGTVFGFLFAVGLAGGMTMPWLAGHLAQRAGLRWVFALAAVNFLAIACLSRVTRRVC